jgi:hypothetical protein
MNILIKIAQEHPDAYCVSPETVHEAIKRGVEKADVYEALVNIMAGKEATSLGIEDKSLCLWVATNDEYYREAENPDNNDNNDNNDDGTLKTSVQKTLDKTSNL